MSDASFHEMEDEAAVAAERQGRQAGEDREFALQRTAAKGLDMQCPDRLPRGANSAKASLAASRSIAGSNVDSCEYHDDVGKKPRWLPVSPAPVRGGNGSGSISTKTGVAMAPRRTTKR